MRPHHGVAGSNAATLAVLGSLTILVGLLRAATIDVPLDHDITYYATTAHEALMGRPFYTWVLDHKPLGVHLAYGAFDAVLGQGLWTLWAMAVATTVATMTAVHVCARRLAGPVAANFAALFWAVVSGTRDMGGHIPNTESFMNPCLMAALALMLGAGGRAGAVRLIAIGACIFLATFFKQVSGAVGMALLVAHVAAPPAPGAAARWRALAESFGAGCVVLAGWAAYVGYFVATGRGGLMHDALVVFNRDYAGSLKANLIDGLRAERMFPSTWGAAFVPVMFAASTAALCGAGRGGAASRISGARARVLVTAFAAGTAAAVHLPGRGYGHYHQLWVPLACVAAGCAAAAWRLAPLPAARHWWPAAPAAAVAFALWMQKATFAAPPDSLDLPPADNIAVHTRNVAIRLRTMVPPGSTLFHWGQESGLYFHGGFRPATGWLSAIGVLDGPLSATLRAKQIKELAAEPPTLIVLSKTDAPAGLAGNHVFDSIRARYTPLPGLPETKFFLLYARRGAVIRGQHTGE